MDQSNNNNVLTDQQKWDHFVQGLRTILSRWTALNLAIEHGWGGVRSQDKGQNLFNQVVQIFETAQSRRNIDFDLEDLFYETLEKDFNTIIEDNSIEQVARDLVRLHSSILKGDLAPLTALLNSKQPSGAKASIFANATESKQPAVEDSEDESDDEEDQMDIDEPSDKAEKTEEEQQEQEDGWQVVRRTKGKKK